MRGIEERPALYDRAMALLDRMGLLGWRRSLVDGQDPGGPPAPVLEVGCGTGRTLALVPEGSAVVGIDPYMDSLRSARTRAPGALLVQARAEALPFRDATFGTVLSSLAFCSVQDPQTGLREIARVLAPGGVLRMLEHVRPRGPLGRRLASGIQPAWTTLTGGCHPDRDTEAEVRRAGFRILEENVRAKGVLRRFDARPGGGSDPAAPR